MHINELEKILSDSLKDFKLDNNERNNFRQLSETLEDDEIGFIRNTAFELARPLIETGGTDAVKVLNWLDRVIKSILPLTKTNRIESTAYFSPGNSCKNKIIALIKSAKQTVNICVFTISDNEITRSILDAHQRGVKVTIISDNDKANDKGSDIAYLADKGVNIILDQSSYHMHHKFAIFDNKILLNGSFNWTRSASDYNEENVMVSGELNLVSMFGKQFKRLENKLI